jgi:hypothetical protein
MRRRPKRRRRQKRSAQGLGLLGFSAHGAAAGVVGAGVGQLPHVVRAVGASRNRDRPEARGVLFRERRARRSLHVPHVSGRRSCHAPCGFGRRKAMRGLPLQPVRPTPLLLLPTPRYISPNPDGRRQPAGPREPAKPVVQQPGRQPRRGGRAQRRGQVRARRKAGFRGWRRRRRCGRQGARGGGGRRRRGGGGGGGGEQAAPGAQEAESERRLWKL